METAEKLAILAKVAAEMNARQLQWAVGGSTLLYFHGIVERFNDIDLMLALKDAAAAKAALLAMGAVEKPAVKSDRFRTVCYEKFTLERLDIDLMAGFTILKDGRAYAFPLSSQTIENVAVAGGEPVPLQALRVWRKCYALMDRPEKAKLIEDYLNAGQPSLPNTPA